jgi:starvation-inducible outer membrane lipoprotein
MATSNQRVEIIDVDSDVKASVEQRGSKGAQVVTSVDASGDPVDAATSAKQDDIVTAVEDLAEIQYEYMGKQTSGDYEYMGFKENGGTNWKIMRKDTTDDSAWQYAYGTSSFTSAWEDVTNLVYDDPPNS